MVAGVRRIALVVLLMLSVLPVVGALRAVTADAQTELIANPSVETAASGSTTLPASWAQGRWGTNTTTFAWATTGHTGSRSLSVNMTARSSGDAKWYFTPVTVAPSTAYVFSDWYKSTAPTQLTAEIRSTTGALSYIWLGDLPAAANWTQATGTFTTPANAAAVTVGAGGGPAVASEKSSVWSVPTAAMRWNTVTAAALAGVVKVPVACVQLAAAGRSPSQM